MIDFEKALKEKLSAETYAIISSSEEEFGKWLDRLKWHAKKCGELQRELEAYREIGLKPEKHLYKAKRTDN